MERGKTVPFASGDLGEEAELQMGVQRFFGGVSGEIGKEGGEAGGI